MNARIRDPPEAFELVKDLVPVHFLDFFAPFHMGKLYLSRKGKKSPHS